MLFWVWPSHLLLQRQLMMEREHSLMAAHAGAMAQQAHQHQQAAELLRMEEEARARVAAATAAASVSRPWTYTAERGFWLRNIPHDSRYLG